MILKQEKGIKITLDRYLDGIAVFTVSGPGIERLRWRGYQNEHHAWSYFLKCLKQNKGGDTMSENTTPIAALCKRYDLSQTALAKHFGIPLRTVQDWHAGRRKAPDYVVEMMARLLDLEK